MVLRLPEGELFIGEFEIKQGASGVPHKGASIALKIISYLAPNAPCFAGRELVIPLQAVAEFLDKEKGECARDSASREIGHENAPIDDFN